MPLRLVDGQYIFNIPVKASIDILQPLGNIFMYCTFRNTKLFGRTPHRTFIFHDKFAELRRSVINNIHVNTPFNQCVTLV